jgi:hypothetical protein
MIGRTYKDGSKAFTAQFIIQKRVLIVHREAQIFDRRQATNVWMVKRQAELKASEGL